MSSQSPIFRTWANMRQRCYNPNSPQYPNYGGRGISICERWNDFNTFVQDMGPRPDGHSIDRIDVDGNYEPSNCRWATNSEQLSNRRPIVYYKRTQTRPMRYITHNRQGYRLCMTLKSKHTYDKKSLTFEEAISLRSDLEFEREMHKRLGLK